MEVLRCVKYVIANDDQLRCSGLPFDVNLCPQCAFVHRRTNRHLLYIGISRDDAIGPGGAADSEIDGDIGRSLGTLHISLGL